MDTSSFSPQLQEAIQKWFDWDKNSSTRKEIEELVNSKNVKELEKRLLVRIAFGTAGFLKISFLFFLTPKYFSKGLRGKMQAGFNSMNDLTVIQASQGLCKYLEKVEKVN